MIEESGSIPETRALKDAERELLHAREGLLSELEVYPIDHEGGFALPDIDKIEIAPV